MSELRPHIGHHIIATIQAKKLLMGWDNDEQKPIWSMDAPAKLRDAVIEFAEDPGAEYED